MDVETRKRMTDLLKETCVLRSVLTKKPCPYFGASETCIDCTYHWIVIVGQISDVFTLSKASYQRERKLRRLAESKLLEANDIICGIEAGIDSVFKAVKYSKRRKKEMDACKN